MSGPKWLYAKLKLASRAAFIEAQAPQKHDHERFR